MPVNHKIEDVLLAAQEFVRQQCIYADNFYIYRQSIDARHKKSIKVHQAGRQGELLPQGQRQPANDRLRRLVDHVSAAVEYAQRGRPVVQGGLQEMGARRR